MASQPDSSPLPRELRAGDTLTWERSLPEYPPADGWTLSYTLVGATSVYKFNAASEAGSYVIKVAATTSAGWGAGRYTLVESVGKSGGEERHTLSATIVNVLPDLATAASGIDTRSHARKVLDNINAWMESRSLTAGELQLGDRRIRQYGLEELLALRDRYAAIVAGEEAGGKGLVRRMLVQL